LDVRRVIRCLECELVVIRRAPTFNDVAICLDWRLETHHLRKT